MSALVEQKIREEEDKIMKYMVYQVVVNAMEKINLEWGGGVEGLLHFSQS